MNLVALVPVSVLALVLAACAGPGPHASAPPSVDQQAWLQQLVGEWAVVAETDMGPEGEPMRTESTEKVRSLGGKWIVAEGSGTFAGEPFASLMTLGYDPDQGRIVGTWVDTVHQHLWTYVGSMDPGGKVLTLETEGPKLDGTAGTSQYRDAIEIKGPDHKVLTSSVRNADGTWTRFLTADYHRKF
jgi:hypothetical protein